MNDKLPDGPIPPFQLKVDPHLVEGALVTQQVQELGACVLDVARALHAMVDALGKQPAINAESFQRDFMTVAAQTWKTGDTPPIVQSLLERLEEATKQRDRGT